MQKLLDSITVSHANINLRENASFDLGHLHINAAPNSKIEFNDLIIDKNADYHGLMSLDLKFDKGCKYDGKKIDMYFNAGQAKLALEASRKSDILALKLGSQQKPIALNDATYKFGKDEKRHCVWKRNSEMPRVHLGETRSGQRLGSPSSI